MPLDEIGRRYADSIYNRRLHELSDQDQEIGALRNRHASRGSLLSGNYIYDHFKLLLQRVDTLAQAKADGLLRAYEKSGLPFGEQAFGESKAEVVEFCHQQQHSLISSMGNTVRQTFGPNNPSGMFDSLSQMIVKEMSAMMGRLVSDLEIRRDETILEDRRAKKAYAAGLGKRWDVFISHASEDKEEFVRPLAKALEQSSLQVWFDETTIKVGDGIRESIDHGLSQSRFGVVVLSKHFFVKKWTKEELEGLSTREISGVKVILPVWHNITREEVAERSPTLAGRFAAQSKDGLEKVVRQLREAMGKD